jgi:hypothetical protein
MRDNKKFQNVASNTEDIFLRPILKLLFASDHISFGLVVLFQILDFFIYFKFQNLSVWSHSAPSLS